MIWDKLECVEFFGAEPEVNDDVHGLSLTFRTARPEGTLEVAVSVTTSDVTVQFFLSTTERPIISLTYLGTPRIRVVKAKASTFLEIAAPGQDLNAPPEGALRIALEPTIALISAAGY
jgi:hypothetical protein